MKLPNIEQRRIPLLGELVDAVFTSLPILSIINFLSIMIVLYNQISPYIKVVAPWVTFKWFMLFLALISFIVMLLTYKFVLPSLWKFRKDQMGQQEKEILDAIKRLEEKIDNKWK